MKTALLARRRLYGSVSFNPASLFAAAGTTGWVYPEEPGTTAWRRNLLTRTEEFDNAAWVVGSPATTVIANQIAAPDGTLTADRLTEVATSAVHFRSQNASIVSGSVYTISMYAKKGIGATAPDWVQLTHGSAAFGASQYANFNISTGAVGTVVDGTAQISDAGSGWYRLSFTATATSTTTAPSGLVFTDNNNAAGRTPSYLGAITSDVYLWGAQLETGTTATDYQRITDVNTEIIANSPGLTLFQDATGTIPVVNPGDPVGLSLDTSGKGNHAFQTTALNRPIYGRHPVTGIRNLLTRTEEFENAAWTKTATITANASVAPDGTSTADLALSSATGSSVQQTPLILAANTAHRISIYMKAGTSSRSNIALFDNTGNGFEGQLYIDWTLGVPSQNATLGNATGAVFQSVGGGWYRVSVTVTTDVVNTSHRIFIYPDIAVGTGNILIWGAQLELGSTTTAYQRVTTAFDVTEAGVASVNYLSHNGTNQWLTTSSFAWGSDKATITAGVRRLVDQSFPVVVEFSVDSTANNGAFGLFADNGARRYAFDSRGTTTAIRASSGSTPANPVTSVASGIGSISGDISQVRLDGVIGNTNTSDQGTGNYGTYPLFLGARNGTILHFNGRRYPSVGINTLLTAAQLAQVEAWVTARTGALG
jgi:hypothetical protein